MNAGHLPNPARRRVLAAGLLAFLPGAQPRAVARNPATATAPAPRAERAVVLWLDGGPSHIDSLDPKPDAPPEIRGPFRTVQTNVPGTFLSEELPLLAARADAFAIVRSLTSPLGEHNFGSEYLLTGFQPSPALRHPSLGALVAGLRPGNGELPPYVALPDANPAAGAGFLPPENRPFVLKADPARPDFRVPDLDPHPGLEADATPERRRRQRAFLDVLETARPAVAASPLRAEREAAHRRAAALLDSPDARAAFELHRENPAIRDRYGRDSLGQSCLLARRLLEARCPFVLVNDPGWDNHANILRELREGFVGGRVGRLPRLDRALSALLDDLRDRSLLDSTLVVVMGEFGRTPKLNSLAGRDHWPRCFSALLAGAGIPGGALLGASDPRGESPAERPVTPADLARTLQTLLGIDPRTTLRTPDGRPVPVAPPGNPIPELLP